MCGRFTLHKAPVEQLKKQFRITKADSMVPSYNITPQQLVTVIGHNSNTQARTMQRFQFGLVPSWAKDATIASKLINARAETVYEKPSFKAAIRQRRCIIPANGFYEWHPKTRQPYYFHAPDEERLLAFAGIWERWQPAGEDKPLYSCAILTTAANDTIEPIHHRMPVLLDDEAVETWLADALPEESCQQLVADARRVPITYRAVSTEVNKPSNNNPSLIESIAEDHVRAG